MKRKATLILLILCLVLSSLGTTFGESVSDLQDHWAKDVIEDWIGQGLIKGYPDGSFKPDNAITRAEFMVLVNKVFNFTDGADINFTDVSNNEWYHNTVATAVGAGYIGGYPDGSMKPNNPISRQEVTVVLSKLNNLEQNVDAIAGFVDTDKIADWAKGYAGAVVVEGYMKGYPDGSFKPLNNITRAEAVVTLNKAITPVIEEPLEDKDIAYDKPGVYGDKYVLTTINGDVTVEAEDITLQNLVIKGDLIIAEEVGKGNVYLNDVTVEGKTYVRGGGTDSIYINGGKFNQIIVEKTSSGDVRIVATNTKGAEIVIVDAAKGQTLTLDGEFKTVTIEADNYKLVTKGDTKIDKIVVKEKVKAAKLDLSKNTVIDRLVADSKVETKGDGQIKLAEGKEVNNSTFAKEPDRTKAPSTGGGGGGGSSSSSKTKLTVKDIGILVDDKKYETSELKKLADDVRVKGIKFTVNTDKSTLKINEIVSEGMEATTDRRINFTSKDAYVGVDTLLGTGQTSVSLGALRGGFGRQVTVIGELSADGYQSYTQSFVLDLGGEGVADDAKNEWADVKVSNDVITATIKIGKEKTKVSEIGIATFINTTFKQLPEKVRITGGWIAVGDSGSYKKIQNQIAGSKSWNNLTLSDLRDKTFDFKAFNNETVYTLKIQ